MLYAHSTTQSANTSAGMFMTLNYKTVLTFQEKHHRFTSNYENSRIKKGQIDPQHNILQKSYNKLALHK